MDHIDTSAMKNKTIIALLFAALCGHAQTVTLTWTPAADTNVTGYWLYTGTLSNSMSPKLYVPGRAASNCVSPITFWVTNWFYMTSTTSVYRLESIPSDKVNFQLLPTMEAPTIRLNWNTQGMTNAQWMVMRTQNFHDWQTVARDVRPPVHLLAAERTAFYAVARQGGL
jgi:hypothetical protein